MTLGRREPGSGMIRAWRGSWPDKVVWSHVRLVCEVAKSLIYMANAPAICGPISGWPLVRRTSMGLHRELRRELGVARSLYQRLRSRHGRWRDPLLSQFVGAGDLVFDIGAHVGDCVASLRRLRALVVAAEPQPGPMRVLRLFHGLDPSVFLEQTAIGEQPGELILHLNLANPTVSTLSEPFIGAACGASGWEGQRWEGRLKVPVTTLDGLIQRYGEPRFCKIDVEGHELQVLRGLSRPLEGLSFEFTTIQREVAQQAVDACERLGRYRYNASLGDSGRLVSVHWLDASSLHGWLERLPSAANSGDIYAIKS